MTNTLLITGANCGLGLHCLKNIGGTSFTRNSNYEEILTSAKSTPFHAIIHCAFNTTRNPTNDQLYRYYSDNLLLLENLLSIPHQKFIYISSIDVYPKDSRIELSEDLPISISDQHSLYATTKILAESIVQERSNNFLILRPSALLGIHARPNSLSKLISGNNPTLSLSKSSSFNYILHSDVTKFIQKALKEDLKGVYNLAASQNITLKEVSQHFHMPAEFGNYEYHTPDIYNTKASKIIPEFKNTSLQNIALFQRELATTN